MKPIARCGAFAMAAVFAVSCVDTGPLPYKPAPISDSGPDVLAITGCDDCVREEPSCGFATCAADNRCATFYQCALEHGCFTMSALNQRISCGGPCFMASGVTNNQDPLLTMILPINGCTIDQGKCASACVLK